MNCHQVLSGACNSGDQCFAVGSVEGIPFTAYAAGCNIVILASNFERVQIIPGAIHGYVRIGSLDCSTDTGKIAAAYGAEVCIFEPTPLIHSAATTHGLEYRWVQTGKLTADGPITALSWNLEGTRLLTGGKILQLWHQASLYQDDSQPSSGVTFQIGGDKEDKPRQQDEDEPGWICVWQCHTATPAHHLAFSPDGVLFATSGINDRLVKIWYQNKVLVQTHGEHSPPELNYTFIYVAHPRAVTHLSWRKTSKYMPKGSVGNVLVTSCVDNICRLWSETLLPEDEWGGGVVAAHSRSPPRRQRATHRHKHRFMQRLKHMKTCFHIRRNAQSSKQPGAPIPTLPSTYSAHDFHNPYHATSYTGGLHFHLAASINAETDIPLVPSLAGGGRFILHWLHNKEMHFTSQAEAILHDLTKKILDKEENEEAGSGSDHTTHPDGENDGSSGNHSHPSLSNTTSINSIATDVTCTHLPDSLDAKIESLLRDWHQSPDLLFSIHPVDGSFLIWVCEWLDELQAGAIRQAQVSFSARIPSAFPLGDATTMCTPAALYHAAAQPLYVRHRTKPVIPGQTGQPEQVTTPLASVQEEKEETEWPQNEEQGEQQENGGREENNNEMQRKTSVVTEELGDNQEGDVLDTAPVISMVTNHTNGTLNLWQLTFDDKSKFSQVLSIGHASRASGHRFRVNDITCHPVLPLLLTTSHHNISDSERNTQPADVDTAAGGLCSELIMWRVECVGPLGKSGGVSELARVNSPHLSAFSNVAWLPTLLPSTTLGNLSNSPSACFVASDGESLRVFQAVIDARTLLAEIATSERRHNDVMHDTMSMSSESTLEEGGGVPLHDRIKIVSQQSTARPGAVIQLHAIADATHDWHNTQLLHVFQQQLITGERTSPDTDSTDSGVEGSEHHLNTITEAGLEAIVDLRKAAVFNEPFYIVVLERTDGGSTVHMWRLTVSSQADPSDELTNSMMYVPDSALVQEDEGEASRKNSVSLDADRALPSAPVHSHIAISTKKVCECPLALPDGVDVIHATPAAGHLSSASIYPACLAPYILATACSDSTLRFWKCDVTKKEDGEFEYTWKEWEMMNKDQESAIDIPGQPLHISAAYSGRIACAYKCGRSFTRPKGSTTNTSTDARFVNLCVCVYECESTGGAEWLLEDTIPLKNVSLPRVGVCADTQIDLSYLHDTSFMQKKQRLTQVLQTFSSDEGRNNRNGEGDTGKSAGLLAVPSFSTLQSLRKSIMENGNTCPLTQKHLVQLDWVSKEDGSHILTVAVGSRVLLFTPVSSDLAQANLKAMKESINNNRPILRKASSLAAPLFVEEIRWMQLRRIELKTADGLPPLPMQISWVRDGILVVGMDSEMHVYSQWKPENPQSSSGLTNGQDLEEGSESRALRDSDLRVSAPHLQRVSSINLQLLERDARRRNKAQPDQPQPLLDYMPDYGLFEASQMACPVLPQYHPKQLMELLNSGKIRWVKAILAHLVRCIGGTYAGRSSTGDEDSLSRQRGWSRSRTLSVSFAAGAASPLDGVAQITEDVQLDYAEITSVPPLPLWTLLVADKESAHHPSTIQEAKDYNELFEGTMDTDEDLDKLLLGEEEGGIDRRPSMPERQPLSHFGPRQGRILSRMLTHTHLPGLSSLDQMHLLALADTVSTCDADFAERFATNTRVDVNMATGQEVLPDSLDDCGLRFLLAMKHYGYLLRCLPLAQRANLQRTGVGTCNLVWAFHSETHEQLLALIPGYAKGQPKWSTMRELGVGWWIRGDLLRTCMEKLARASYMQKQDPMDAALYYLAMKKKNLLWGLFRSNRDEKMTAFFSNNFAEDRWRKAALKNAFVLLGKQRFEHAAAFFLLGGALKDALEVLITRLGDLQLAMVVSRLYESDNTLPDSLRKLLMDEILGGETEDESIELERAHPDPFVRSMALWELKRYGEALDTLLSPAGRLHAARDNEPMPSVFNFYVYLRTHPRLKRHNLPSQGGHLALLQNEADEGITRLERRLYFQTAHGHFKAGCPALALEVLSKLPARVRDEKPRHPVSAPSVDHGVIHTGQLGQATTAKKLESPRIEVVDWSAASADVDWSAPVEVVKNDDLVLNWDDDDDDKGSGGSGASTPPLEMKMDKKETVEEQVNGVGEKEKEDEPPTVDIMAQQLKFVACLKILMEELSTLATGFEVDGGHLRYQLYIWLEREVEALRRLCGYASAPSASGGGELICADADPPPLPERPTLHQLLIREKADFEAKVQRAVGRKKWLKANETLLRTLLSYCSLHGAGGGGLASVRMELVLLLQELGQDKQHQQLLSPLPFPTTLPLLAAAVAANNTVVADPVRHLQSVAHDMLGTIGELGIPGGSATRILHTLRELAVALSACIYQSLCDSDTFSLKHTHHHDGIIAETPGSTHHLLARQRRQSIDELQITTTPNKWPGVSALRGLALRAAEEDDAPRLPVLLAEAFCAVYLALLGWALAARDAHLLYRLAAQTADVKAHARLFGGGVRRLLTTAPAVPQPTLERKEGTSVWSSLREKRALLNMRLLGLGPTVPHKNIQEGRPTYREQFVPPHCSILTFLLTKPSPEQDPENYDYDSAESGAEDAEDSGSEVDDDDIFDTSTTKKEKKSKFTNTEHSDPDSYSWYVMRVAVLRLAQQKLQHFLQMCGIEMSELATTSPTIHAALRRVDQWQQQLTETLEARAPPPDYIPGCFPDQQTSGPPINKYKCLLEKHNTPFNSSLWSAAPARRLWNFLVRQEPVQEVFIRAVFSRRRTQSLSVEAAGEGRSGCVSLQRRDDETHSPVRIIHKEQDSIAAFCLNRVGGGLLAVATAREVQEMDVSLLLRGGACWAEDECEVDLLGLASDPATLPDTGFLLIQHQDKPNSIPGTGNSSPLNPNAPQVPIGMASQTGRGASVVLKHKIDNIKRMAAHPTQPLYLTGGADGSVQLWEWGHPSCVWSPRAPGAFAKVTRVRFSDYGNKFAAADADGNLAMWQLHPSASQHQPGQPHASPRPFFTHQCHSKGISDFVFLGSCSLVATAGHSSESKNVAIWDTLMPIKKALVVSWTCHEGGAAAVAWAGTTGALVSCGRRGDVLVWDLRARAPRHKLHAHHAPIKCVALSPREDMYAIGAADGDIKVFSLATHQLLHTFAGEHARSSFFKHIGQGVTQIHIDNAGRLFSCGADGTMKVRKLPERDAPPPHQPHY